MATIQFRVNLETPLHKSHVAPTQTYTEANNFRNTRDTWFPDDLNNNRQLQHGDTFTVSGEEALYLKNNYTSGDYAILSVVSETLP